MQVIILEDEIPAYNKLSNYLLDYAPHAQIIGWYRSIEDALTEKDNFKTCELVLSDIKLLDGTSIELFNDLNFSCPIIFCTAYNNYLQDAFETNGIAYLLKPYSKESFSKAMQKFDTFFNQKNQPALNKSTIHLIKDLLHKNNVGYKQRLSIRKKNGIIVMPMTDITFFQACGDFCILIDSKGEKHTVNYKISQLENQLDPNYFFRINRSEIVNISFINSATTYFKNKMQIALTNDITLTTSGTRTPEFRLWLDGKFYD